MSVATMDPRREFHIAEAHPLDDPVTRAHHSLNEAQAKASACMIAAAEASAEGRVDEARAVMDKLQSFGRALSEGRA